MKEKINAVIAEMQLKADELWETAIELNEKGWFNAAFTFEDQAALLEEFIAKLEVANNG